MSMSPRGPVWPELGQALCVLPQPVPVPINPAGSTSLESGITCGSHLLSAPLPHRSLSLEGRAWMKTFRTESSKVSHSLRVVQLRVLMFIPLYCKKTLNEPLVCGWSHVSVGVILLFSSSLD